MGEKGAKGQPVGLKTFRLTSNDRGVLESAAKLYGGKVAAWEDAPDAGMWQLTTGAAELDILIPRSLRSLSQMWELWQGGTCERRCDGRVESIGATPCLCGPSRGEDGFCEIMTRLSIILPRLPGLGLWRLDTGGWHAASTLGPTVELLLALDPRSMVPAVLRAVPGSSKVRDAAGKVTTHRFIRPMIDAPGITIGQLVAGSESEPPKLAAGPAPRPQTAEERVARQRAAVEERQAAVIVTPVVAAAADGVVEGESTEVPAEVPTNRQILDACDAAGIDGQELTARLFPDRDPHTPLLAAQKIALMAAIRQATADA
jgi:hypothetical protein